MKFKLDEMDSNGILMVFTEVCSVCMCILAISSKAGSTGKMFGIFGLLNASITDWWFGT